MSGIFQNIDPPTPLTARPLVREGDFRWGERGVGVNILEDARHSSVLYICKCFVLQTLFRLGGLSMGSIQHIELETDSFLSEAIFTVHSRRCAIVFGCRITQEKKV
jgi:hypothetical protein